MKAIVTVIGKDQVGIIAGVCTKLAEYQVNVLDISRFCEDFGPFEPVSLQTGIRRLVEFYEAQGGAAAR